MFVKYFVKLDNSYFVEIRAQPDFLVLIYIYTYFEVTNLFSSL